MRRRQCQLEKQVNITIREFEKSDWIPMAMMSDDEWGSQVAVVAKAMHESTNGVERCLVADKGNELVGMIYGFVLPNGTLLPELLYVMVEYRKCGIASQLLSEFESRYGCSASMIFYHKSLHGFYEKMGYQHGDQLEVAIKEIPSGG